MVPVLVSASRYTERGTVSQPDLRAGLSAVRTPLDLLRIVTIVVLLSYVWRIQDLFLILTTLKVSFVASVSAIALFALSPAALRSLNRWRHPVVRLALASLAIMILTVPTSLWQGKSFAFIRDDHLKTIIMMMLVVASTRSFADVERYAAAHVMGGAIYSAFVVFRLSVGPGGRLGSLFYYDANDLGMLLVCTLPLILYFSRRGAPLVARITTMPIGALYIMAIVKTGSRGAFLGLIAIAIFTLLTFAAVSARSRVASVAGGVLALFMIASDQYWTQMQTILNPQNDYNWSGKSETGRMEIWKRGVGYMLDRPLTGVGVQAFQVAEGTISPLADRQNSGKGVKWTAAHNAFVQVGAETGVPGLLAFVGMLVVAFRSMGSIAKHRRHDDKQRRAEAAMAQAMRISIVGYVVTCFFLSQGYAAFLYALLGLITAHSAVAGLRVGVRAPRWSAQRIPAARRRAHA